MLHQHHGALGGEFEDQIHHRLGLFRRHPSRRLVEQQQAWIGGQRHGDFQRALFTMRHRAGGAVASIRQAHNGQQRIRLVGQFRQGGAWFPDLIARHQRLQRHPHVFMHRQLREDIGDLKGFGDAEGGEFMLRGAGDIASLEDNPTLAGREGTGE